MADYWPTVPPSQPAPEPRLLPCPDDADHGVQPVISVVYVTESGINSYRLACLHVAVVDEGQPAS